MNSITEEITNESNPTWNNCYEKLVSKKFNNHTLFNALNSRSLKLKKLAVNEAKKSFASYKKTILNELKDNINFKDIEIEFIYKNLNKVIPKNLEASASTISKSNSPPILNFLKKVSIKSSSILV